MTRVLLFPWVVSVLGGDRRVVNKHWVSWDLVLLKVLCISSLINCRFGRVLTWGW